MTKVWILLMFISTYNNTGNGGPMIVDGFSSKETCMAASVEIIAAYDKGQNPDKFLNVRGVTPIAKCIEIKK